MIISASRRTDIPAFYSQWFLNRLREGYVYVRNPMNASQISKVSLATEVVDCIVFWTKNALPMQNALKSIEAMGYSYYLQWTITPYGRDLEPFVPAREESVAAFRRVSDMVGSSRMVWRYDPVIISSNFSPDFHAAAFEHLCKELAGYTGRCVFSYLDFYPKLKKKVRNLAFFDVDEQIRMAVAERFSQIAARYGISLEACCESPELGRFGIQTASCINRELLEQSIGVPISVKKGQGQRSGCQCVESIDIGCYNSCPHGCVYCYANTGETGPQGSVRRHDVHSPLLIGRPGENERIVERKMKSLRLPQTELF